MKKSHLKELSGKLLGSVTDNPESLAYFSTDQSIFQITPSAVVYPQNTADVRKTVQFVAELAAAGKPLSLVPRGRGTDTGGGSIGEGIQLVLPAHMDKLLRLDRDSVTVQPGILYQTLQQTLHTHGRFLPPYPADIASATVGGAVANNASGEKSVKYGSTREFVKGLKVVLSDGSLIQTHRIGARELNRKKGLTTLEGELYRKVDSLLLDHADLIKKRHIHTTKNTAGYALDNVRGKDGSFDLSQVIIGSQGTLGVITEITLKTMAYNPRTTLVVGYFNTAEGAAATVAKLRPLAPSAIEFIDRHLLEYLRENHPGELASLAADQLPKIVLFVEFDEFSQLSQKLKSNRARHIMARHGGTCHVATDPLEQVALWRPRRAGVANLWMNHGAAKALPFMDDAVVPAERLPQLLDKTYKLLKKHDLETAVWGSAGDGHIHVQPFLDLAKKKDVEKLFTLSREYAQIVSSLGGTTSGGQNDGLIRALSLGAVYGEEMTELFASVKHIFDPHSIFNPMKKTEATEAYARDHLRTEYAIKHFDHLFYT